jgi:Helix-turn-helix domain
MKAIGEILSEQNIKLDTLDPVAQGGFTQVPNFILRSQSISMGAKMAYAMFLSYAWHNDHCFPGQDRLAVDMGLGRSTVTAFVSELQRSGFVSIQRRGQGKTNIYTIHFKVGKPAQLSEVGRLTSRSRLADIKRSAHRPLSI